MVRSLNILLMIVLCIAGAILNYFINYFVCLNLLIPLYLDTIITIAMTFIAGPLWGCITGALTNIFGILINPNLGDWDSSLYALCSVATALVIRFFIRIFPREINLHYKQENDAQIFFKSRRFGNTMDRIIVLTLASFALCLVMSIMGGTITAIININRQPVTEMASPELVSKTMFSSNMPFILSQILSRIPINIVDRLISVFAGFGIAYMVIFIYKRSNSRRVRIPVLS